MSADTRPTNAAEQLDAIRRAVMGDTPCSDLLPYIESLAREVNDLREAFDVLSEAACKATGMGPDEDICAVDLAAELAHLLRGVTPGGEP